MMNQDSTQILIVGAGPSGLAAALLLSKLGVSVRIIDKNAGRTDKSKALGVQAGTLECLAAAIGQEITDQFVSSGKKVREANIHLEGSEAIQVDLGVIASRYNFILILEQSETERILEEHLNKNGVFVERQTELISLEDQGNKIISHLKKAGEDTLVLDTKYVLGCDGAHSVVRTQLGIGFEGGSYAGDFILGDVTIASPYQSGEVHTFVTSKGELICFPMKDDKKTRLIIVPQKPTSTDAGSEISFDEFKSLVDEMSDSKIQVQSAFWLSRFRVHHRMAKQFEKGRGFLVGDAAHIHSPAGGQGMNTGIQDALNISFKLKSVLGRETSSEILANYEKERMPVAKGILRATDVFTKIMLLRQNPAVKFVRRNILPLVVRSKTIQGIVVKSMSEVRAAREEIKSYPKPH